MATKKEGKGGETGEIPAVANPPGQGGDTSFTSFAAFSPGGGREHPDQCRSACRRQGFRVGSQIRHLWSFQPRPMATLIRPLRFADFQFLVGVLMRGVEKDQTVSVHLDNH